MIGKEGYKQKAIFISIRFIIFILLINSSFILYQKNTFLNDSLSLLEKPENETSKTVFTSLSSPQEKNYTLINHWFESNFTDFTDFAITEKTLYIIDDNNFYIYNISNIKTPQIIYNVKYNNEHQPEKIIVKNELAFISASSNCQYIDYYNSIDIYNVTNLTQVEKLTTFPYYYFSDFAINGNYLYISSTWDGLKIVDISNPILPKIVSELFLLRQYIKLFVTDGYLFMLTKEDFIIAINATNHNNLQILFEKNFIEEVTDLFIDNDILYLSSRSAIMIIDITDKTKPSVIAIRSINIYLLGYPISNIFVRNQTLFVTYIWQLLIFNLSPIMEPILVNTIGAHYNRINKVIVFNNFVFVNNRTNILTVYDITNLTKEVLLYKNQIPETNELDLDEGIAIVNDALTGIKFFNFTNANRRELLSIYPTNHRIWNVAIQGHFAYYIDNSHLVILNITDPYQPVLIKTIDNCGGRRLIAQNDYVYIADENRFIIVNITDKNNPYITDEYFAASSIYDIAIDTEKGALSTEEGYYLLDLRDKSNIVPVGLFGEDIQMQFIELKEDILFIAAYGKGLLMVNISDVYNPMLYTQISAIEIGTVYRLSCDESNLIYLITANWAMIVYNITDLNNITLYGRYKSNGYNYWGYDYDFLGKEGLVYVVSEEKGISIIGTDIDNDLLADYLEEEIYFTDKYDRDSDNDTMSDGFEVRYDLNPTNSSDSVLDNDFDSLTNAEEFFYSTNPKLDDSDLDGLLDAEELIYQTNPILCDTDGDCLLDSFEIKVIGSNPLQEDTDNDLLNDWYEWCYYRTNPNYYDSDFDLISDGYEVKNYLNPLDKTDAQLDLDLDGLTNLEEYYLGTKAYLSDTDRDGYTDSEEIEAGTDPLDNTDYPNYTKSQIPYPTQKSSLTIGVIVICIIPSLIILNLQEKRKKL